MTPAKARPPRGPISVTAPAPITLAAGQEDLHALLQQREREMEILLESAQEVGRDLDLQRVLQRIADRAGTLVRADSILIPLIDGDGQSYTYRAGSGSHAAEVVGETLPLDFGICGWVWKHQRPWWGGVIDELDETERTHWEKQAGTVLLVPLIGRERFLGGIAALGKTGGGDFNRTDLHLLSLFASQVVIAIDNAMTVARIEAARLESERLREQLAAANLELSRVNQELELLSLYDSLTHLPNRSLFRDRANQAIGIARREGTPTSLLLVDLDQFKEINDTLGHETGDQLLKEVADRFAAQMGYADTVSRLGSDEFGLVLTQADTDDARAFADSLLRVLEAPFRHGQQELSISASIGIATFPRHGNEATTLMRHADTAMYRAKRNRLNVATYDARLHEASPRQLLLRGNLRRGLAEQQFLLHYQPKIDLRRHKLVGVEALARWRHPEHGLIMPDVFIPALEDSGLINTFNLWALETALAQIAAWRQRGMLLHMSVNMSVLSLITPTSFAELESLLAASPDSRALMLEITENLFLSDYGRLGDALGRLRDLGVTFSIDDFGTGHSSLARLKKLPVSELKIDRSFITDMAQNPDDAIIVRSTVELAHNLGLSVVAEGVENAQVLAQLMAIGCDVVQGYHFGRPMPADELAQAAKTNQWINLG